ncbi:hypothetical protein BH23ACT6_BH23ACT6_10450 [soil metagenome]
MPRPDLLLHVRLRHHARPLRRGPGQVQFGLNAEHGVVLEGLTEAEVMWLLSLPTGTGAGRGSTDLVAGNIAAGHRWGLAATRVSWLLDLLHTHDLLAAPAEHSGSNREPEPNSAQHQVSVLGGGSTTESIRAGIAAVGPVRVWDYLEPGTRPDVVLLVVNEAVGPSDAKAWARSGIRHTPVVVHQHRVVLGPVVAPGEGPCLVCLDLRRTDRDAAWPLVAAQFDAVPSEWAAPVNAEPALTAAATGLCALLVRALVQGARVPPGVTWEVSSPLPQVTTRHWLPHPWCTAHTHTHSEPSAARPHAAC